MIERSYKIMGSIFDDDFIEYCANKYLGIKQFKKCRSELLQRIVDNKITFEQYIYIMYDMLRWEIKNERCF